MEQTAIPLAEQPHRFLLRLRGRTLRLSSVPLLMGVVNASPDSFSDPGHAGPDGHVQLGRELAEAGAALIDVGGESGRTDRPAVTEREEAARIVPVIERLAAELVSVDTWRAPVRAHSRQEPRWSTT
jgi:dihydropteroate synthase